MRVYELAKELGVQNRDLVSKIRGLGIQVANHMSVLEGADADKVRRALIRERHDSLEEVRLNDTVIRRRSRSAVSPSPTAARAVARQQAAAAAEEKARQEAEARAKKEAEEAARKEKERLEAEERAKREEAARAEAARRAEEEKAAAEAAALEAAKRAAEVERSGADGVATASAADTSSAAGGSGAAAKPASESPTAAASAAPALQPRKVIPQPVVTGSAATGRFIQLPEQNRETVPRVEITNRDDDRRGRGGGLFNRPGGGGPGGRFGRPGFGPGGRPGGPPRKRQPVAGKKLKQTQITTPAEHKRIVRMSEAITVADLAQKMGVKGNEVVKRLWALGMMGININQSVDQDTAALVANEFGYQIESKAFREEDILGAEAKDAEEDLKPRAPVITIMGHVDHGKTSLLDAIRQTDVVKGEAGGITQHIGAYKVKAETGDVAFLDTPGHEAFTAMRARGAKMTDIVVLVVAADDGPMPQTLEAIKHAKAAEVPLIVAVNKIDKEEANPLAIRQKLMEHELVPEEFGGETIFVDVSAKTRDGINKLLEMLALQAEVLELKANPKKPARGHLVEARLDRSRGPISTVLVEAGTLRTGDTIVAGTFSGKVRAMLDDRGKQLAEAGPSTPVEILGLDGVPEAGDTFNAVADEKLVKQLVEHRREAKRNKESAAAARGVSLENIFSQIKDGEVKEVKIVLKADVQGSAEAVSAALEKLSTNNVGVKVISAGVGGITESDVTLAKASNGICIGFNVRPAGKAHQVAESEGVEIKTYQVIYDAIDDVKKAMVGMLEPVEREKVLGQIQVRQIFTIPKIGTIAGCMVLEGKVHRRNQVRLIRDSVVIYTGKLGSLRRFKDDVAEVDKGYECGLSIEGYQDLQDGDVLEVFEVEQVAATLDDGPRAAQKEA